MGQGRWRAWQSHDHPNSSLEKSATFSTTRIIPNSMDCQLAFVHQTDFIRLHSMGFFKLQSSSLLVKKDTNLPTIIASKCQFRHLFLEAPSFIPPPSQALPNALLRISRPWLRKKSPPLRRAWWPYVMRPRSWWKLHRRWPRRSGFLKKNVWNSKSLDTKVLWCF